MDCALRRRVAPCRCGERLRGSVRKGRRRRRNQRGYPQNAPGMVFVFGLILRTIIPYRVFPDNLGSHVYWAAINVQIALPVPNAPRTKRFEGIIDSGATRCLFHASFAAHLGIDLKSGTQELTSGIGGREETWLHPVSLYIPGGPVKILAAFKESLPLAALLGTSGFFDHFNITFEPGQKRCVLDRIYYA